MRAGKVGALPVRSGSIDAMLRTRVSSMPVVRVVLVLLRFFEDLEGGDGEVQFRLDALQGQGERVRRGIP